jgi:alpha-glucosidase (family GH31 glycosyl hydrolase)
MWTGDSQTDYDNVLQSVNQLLTLGVSGIVNGGCDIPGFYGAPSDDLFVQFYQLGVFYPFMRAHNNIAYSEEDNETNFADREPWL